MRRLQTGAHPRPLTNLPRRLPAKLAKLGWFLLQIYPAPFSTQIPLNASTVYLLALHTSPKPETVLARVALKAAAGTAMRWLLVRRRVVREDPWLSHQALRVLLEQGSGKPLRKRVTTVASRFHPHDLNAFSLPYLRTNELVLGVPVLRSLGLAMLFAQPDRNL